MFVTQQKSLSNRAKVISMISNSVQPRTNYMEYDTTALWLLQIQMSDAAFFCPTLENEYLLLSALSNVLSVACVHIWEFPLQPGNHHWMADKVVNTSGEFGQIHTNCDVSFQHIMDICVF